MTSVILAVLMTGCATEEGPVLVSSMEEIVGSWHTEKQRGSDVLKDDWGAAVSDFVVAAPDSAGVSDVEWTFQTIDVYDGFTYDISYSCLGRVPAFGTLNLYDCWREDLYLYDNGSEEVAADLHPYDEMTFHSVRTDGALLLFSAYVFELE